MIENNLSNFFTNYFQDANRMENTIRHWLQPLYPFWLAHIIPHVPLENLDIL